ncbi:excinuclease ABC, C subunit [Desulfosporosinus orientis DSM 765]|uniref:UvrABC system protein C n=1 Tax=Desulfosporosinus orientis (strain ATCC 19365 / DSM 765 / NCIMB 8382 / VKM B-1628 / Singapore I) TaxID=768706 RepID=G7WFM3_DESOD|nr:excinuclease ABC subunit UvrC [Desulfosporosinus orientis]AET68896.1 excinuclease ABC, C subunit [Desulfosporosinus orientis DSM 765]
MDLLRQKLILLPEKPGVYLMKDRQGQIIYVGKAKTLKNRVKSYFTGSHDGKTGRLVSQITDFEYITTDSEVEALVLECNLIKKYNPKYNILLRDDKTYPYLTITEESHPRVLVTRQIKKGSGKYFGPYPNSTAAKEATRLLNRLFPFRKCRQIPAKPCLYFHLEQCLAPCIKTISPDVYQSMRKEVSTFLKGDQSGILTLLQEKMLAASEALQFERAREYRDLIEDLKQLGEKQNITLNDFVDRDVLGYAVTNDQMCIQIFYLRQGKLLARDSFIFPYYEDPEEAFISFVAQFYIERTVWPKEILLPSVETLVLANLFPVIVPQKGKKRELIQMAMTNAKTTLHDQITLEINQQSEISQALTTLGELLIIPVPKRIEAFDISNIAGTHTVAGMVQFIEGKPQRKGYRKFKIQPMEVSDDTASMRQVIMRRYSRLLSEKENLPDLILVDGGKGQVTAALKALQELDLTIPVAGMVKNDRHQTHGLIDSSGAMLPLSKSHPTFFLLGRIQDEVHRFAITFHRQQRAKNMTLSTLDNITGVGPKRKQQLLRHFSSLDDIQHASMEELQAAGVPQNTAKNIYAHFRGML